MWSRTGLPYERKSEGTEGMLIVVGMTKHADVGVYEDATSAQFDLHKTAVACAAPIHIDQDERHKDWRNRRRFRYDD